MTIDGQRIVAVGKTAGGEELQDLGSVALLPGLVNAHTHLEFSELSKPLGEPGIGFVDWLRHVMQHRLDVLSRRPLEKGLREAARCGTTTLGEIAQVGWPVEQVEAARLGVTVFLELIGPTARRIPSALELARRHLEAAKHSARWLPGLSPHAPYSVHPQLLAAVTSLSATEGVPIGFHLAESREELELLRCGGGMIRRRLEELGAWDPSAIPPGTRPLDYLHTLAAAHRTLIIHGNYLDDEEIAFLAGHAQRMAVIYCPRTHAYFNHPAYPLERMLAAGVRVALGTDSRASSPDLSLLAEMRFVAEKFPAVGRDLILQLGTIRAAEALGLETELGSLDPGKYANLAAVALPDRHAADPHELLFASDRPVVGTWYRGVKITEG